VLRLEKEDSSEGIVTNNVPGLKIVKSWAYGGQHLMVIQFVILLWRDFNHVKILDWNVNKSDSRLYINAPKVE